VRTLLLLTAAATLLAACGTPAGSGGAATNNGGPPATGSGTILFVRGDNIFSTAASGGAEVQLTHESNGNFANNPIFSPDGSTIAYAHHVAPSGNNWGGVELHLMQADGTGDNVLVPSKTKGERAETPAWTPDGQSIYFAHDVPIIDDHDKYTGDTLTVERYDLGSGKSEVVQRDAIMPAIGKTGSMAWVNYNVTNSSFKLQVSSAPGDTPRTLLSDKDFQAILSPAISPDGQAILFSGSGRTSSTVGSVGRTLAQALNPLVPGEAEAHGLPWDPWVIGIDGKGLKKLASIGSDEQSMSWSPDGQEIVFSNLSSTYLMRADGSGLTRLLNHGDPGGISWKA